MRWLIVFSLILVSCAGQKKDPSSHVTLRGLRNFGQVILGDQVESEYSLINDSEEAASVSLSLSAPFYVVGASPSACTPYLVPKKTECFYKIRFSPDQKGHFQFSLSFLSESLSFIGEGILPGQMSLSPSAFDLGQMTAGEEKTVEVQLLNSGEANLAFPDLAFDLETAFLSTTCDQLIAPKTSCLIRFKVSPRLKTDAFAKTITLTSGLNKIEVVLSGSVRAGPSSGTISFSLDPNKQVLLQNENLNISVQTQPLLDQFGNVVEDGTSVTVNVSNLVLDNLFLNNQPVLTKTYLTLSGVVTFSVKAQNQPDGTLAAGFSAQTETSFGSYQFSVIKGP